MSLPPFQDFVDNLSENLDSLDYDISRFCSERLKTPGNPFSREEYTILVQTVQAMTLAILAQYHEFLKKEIER